MIDAQTNTLQFNDTSQPESVGVQMAPLIDVVFLLICFFMFATQLITSQIDLSVQLPEMSNPRAVTEAPAELVLNLRDDGALTINGLEMRREHLTAFLLKERQRAESEDAPLRVIIRADRRERYARLAELLRSCREAGMNVVVLRSQKEGVQ
jgi:biopolymer transport protein ExbD